MAIEFAAVFVLFFGIFYATVSYAFPLLLSQAMNVAVAEGARAALAVAPEVEEYHDRLQEVARERTHDYLEESLMVALFPGDFAISADVDDGVLRVEAAYDYDAAPLIIPLQLPLIGTVPRLPDQLRAVSSIEL